MDDNVIKYVITRASFEYYCFFIAVIFESGIGTRYMRYKGYIYRNNHTGLNSRVFWVCRKRQSMKCKATAVTIDSVLVKINNIHSHNPTTSTL